LGYPDFSKGTGARAMKIKFLFGYSGRETAMRTYDVDDIADLPQAQAMELVRLGVAEEVEEEIESSIGETKGDFGTLPDFNPEVERVAKPRKGKATK